MFWDFDDDFWDFDPEDFVVYGGVWSLIEDDNDRNEMLKKQMDDYSDEGYPF